VNTGIGQRRIPEGHAKIVVLGKVEEAQVPDETGAAPVDHEAIFAFVTALG
jgi:hypothetical protein